MVMGGDATGGGLGLSVLDEICGDVGSLYFVDLLLVARQRPLDQKMVGDIPDLDLEDTRRTADLRIVVGIDHLLPLGEAVDRSSLIKVVYILLLQETPIALAREALVIQGLDSIFSRALGDADLIDVLGETDVGGPTRQILAGCDIHNRHSRPAWPISPPRQ